MTCENPDEEDDEIPYELGWKAGLDGIDPRLCPYPKLTKEWYEWQRAQGLAIKTFYDEEEE